MSSLENIFSAAKNLVIAVNELTSNYRMITGTKHSENLEAATTTVLANGHGYVAAVNVTVAGTTVGSIYDTTKKTSPGPSTLLAVIPNTVGRTEIRMPYFDGLVVTTGTGQNVTVSYS